MLNIEQTNAFKRDLKKVKSQGKKFELLDEVIEYLIKGISLPIRYKNHKLSGNYKNYFELYTQPDWLLIYKINKNTLYLIRTGSHAELFI